MTIDQLLSNLREAALAAHEAHAMIRELEETIDSLSLQLCETRQRLADAKAKNKHLRAELKQLKGG